MPAKAVESAVKGEAVMDMTPMIDVTFLLLVFFLCIEFRSLEAKVAAYLPKDAGISTARSEPAEKLDLRIFCEQKGTRVFEPGAKRFELVGHEVRFELGAKAIRDEAVLRAELARLVEERVVDPATGRTKKRPVTIHAHEDVTYGDVARAVDLLKDVGFEQIHFAAGRAARKR
jgi:biopolymer transport protein ExbD